jgi:DNA-binding PadR family transcriptional regulator
MADQELYSGLIRLHVLYHASQAPVFGLGMIRELRHHGYRVGPGTLYPILHRLEAKGYLRSRAHLIEKKFRRIYTITARGKAALRDAADKVRELYDEMVEGEGDDSPAHPR